MGKHEFIHVREATLADCDQIDEITYRGFIRGTVQDRRQLQQPSSYVCVVKGSALMRQQGAVTFVAVKVQESRRDRLRRFMLKGSDHRRGLSNSSRTIFRRRPARHFIDDNSEPHSLPPTASRSARIPHNSTGSRIFKSDLSPSSLESQAAFDQDDTDLDFMADLCHHHQEIVGCVTYATHASEWSMISDEDEAEVRMLAVTSKSDTAAKDLIEHAIFVAKRHGKTRLSTLIPPNAAQAVVTFYRNLGFRRCEYKDYVDPMTRRTLLAYSYEIHFPYRHEIEEGKDLLLCQGSSLTAETLDTLGK